MRLRYFKMYSGKQLTKVMTTTFHKNSVDMRNFSSERKNKEREVIYQINYTKSSRTSENQVIQDNIRTHEHR